MGTDIREKGFWEKAFAAVGLEAGKDKCDLELYIEIEGEEISMLSVLEEVEGATVAQQLNAAGAMLRAAKRQGAKADIYDWLDITGLRNL